MPNSPEPSTVDSLTIGVVPRMPMVATGVVIATEPVFATWPVMKTNVPCTRLIAIALSLRAGS